LLDRLLAQLVEFCLVGKGSNIKKPFIIGTVSLALILVIIFFGLSPQYVLSIEDMTNGKTVLEKIATPGDNLWIVFINSVEKLPVADHFVVNDDHKILFTETIFQAPYAGYDGSGGAGSEELIAPGTTRISGYDRQMDKVTFFAGYTFKHTLLLNGHWLPLYGVVQGGDLVQITIKKRSRWASLFRRTPPTELKIED
jgi:hypothetical protein